MLTLEEARQLWEAIREPCWNKAKIKALGKMNILATVNEFSSCIRELEDK